MSIAFCSEENMPPKASSHCSIISLAEASSYSTILSAKADNSPTNSASDSLAILFA
jgi:hypothetical protein